MIVHVTESDCFCGCDYAESDSSVCVYDQNSDWGRFCASKRVIVSVTVIMTVSDIDCACDKDPDCDCVHQG